MFCFSLTRTECSLLFVSRVPLYTNTQGIRHCFDTCEPFKIGLIYKLKYILQKLMWFYYRLLQINYVPFQQIFLFLFHHGTEPFYLGWSLLNNFLLVFTYFPPQEQKCTSRNALYPSSYACINRVVWSPALYGVKVLGNSPISSKY